ncbi:MAG: hypothetical protein H0U95_04230 [Bacteroidetes bacterium]|nr:hypothetical protein [Bacteroidota bacterium]
MKTKIVILFIFFSITKAQAQVGIGFHPISKSLSFKSAMNKKWFIETKVNFEIANALLYSFQPSINYRMMNKETVKFYSGMGINFEIHTKSFILPFGMEVFPFEKIRTLSLNLESGLNFLLIPGYTKMNIIGDIGVTYYFEKKQKKELKNE